MISYIDAGAGAALAAAAVSGFAGLRIVVSKLVRRPKPQPDNPVTEQPLL